MTRWTARVAIALCLIATARAQESSPQISEFTVNGLKVLVKPRPGTQTVAAGLFIRGGSANITVENAGLESLTLDLATEASMKFPRATFRREMSRTGSVIAFGINNDYSVLSLTSTRQHFDRSWAIFADTAINPAFDPEDFERVKRRRLTALADDEDTPDSFLSVLEARAVYTGHPYAAPPRGTTESVAKLTLDDVRRFHRQIMQTSRMLLVVVGGVTPEQIRQKVMAAFSTLPRGAYSRGPVRPLEFSEPSLSVTEREIPTNYVMGVFAAPPLSSPDIYPMRVLRSILHDRLFDRIRVQRNLSYAPEASLRSAAANTGYVYVTSTDANQSVQIMLEELGRLQREELSARQLTVLAQQFLTHYYVTQETNAAQAAELASYELNGGGWREAQDALTRLRAVTAADVKRVANTYLRNLQWIVLGNPRSIDRRTFLQQPGK